MACLVVGDFPKCSYGFRPKRSAYEALESVRENLHRGLTAVYDVDLQSHFDMIAHDKLITCVRMRMSDRSSLALIRMWLSAVVIEPKSDGGSPTVSLSTQGVAQGGVILPPTCQFLLALVRSQARPTKLGQRKGSTPCPNRAIGVTPGRIEIM